MGHISDQLAREAPAAKVVEQDRGTLTTDAVVNAALRLTHEHGLGGLTTRRLCSDLSVTAPMIYHHVGSMQNLYELVADAVIAGISVPSGKPWDTTLIELLRRTRSAFAKYPGVATFVNGHRPLPAATRLADVSLGLLLSGGFAPDAALKVYHCLTVYNMGQMLADAPDPLASGTSKSVATFLPRSAPTDLPHLIAATAATGGLNPGDTHLTGIRWILDGAARATGQN